MYSLGVIFYELLYGRRPDETGDLPADQTRGKLRRLLGRFWRRSRWLRPIRRSGRSEKDLLPGHGPRPGSAASDGAWPLADELKEWLQQQRTTEVKNFAVGPPNAHRRHRRARHPCGTGGSADGMGQPAGMAPAAASPWLDHSQAPGGGFGPTNGPGPRSLHW